MSTTTRLWTRKEAARLGTEDLVALIERLESHPIWKGVEFDDSRVRHKARVRLKTLKAELDARTQEKTI